MNLEARCDAIEECYEFMLAYAAQGLADDAGSSSGAQIREFLRRAAAALTGLSETYVATIVHEDLQPMERYRAFLPVLNRDAEDSLAAIELVLAPTGDQFPVDR